MADRKPLSNWVASDGLPSIVADHVASSTARLAYSHFPGKTAFDSSDVGKVIMQDDDKSTWVCVAVSPLFWHRNDSDTIYVGPPVDGVTDDWAAINAVVQAAPAGSTVKLIHSTLPYICDHTRIDAKSDITLDINGNTVVSTTAYGLSTCPIVANPGTPPVIASLASDCTTSSTTMSVTWAGSDRLVVGDYFFAGTAAGGRVSFRVTNVSGTTITLDIPAWFTIVTGTTLCKYTPVRNFKVLANGAHFKATFDGPFEDNRLIELISTWNCEVIGPGRFEQVGGATASIAIIGFDIGGRSNLVDNVDVIGLDGNINSSGVAIEGQRGSTVRNIRGRNIGFPLWTNSTFYCEYDGVLAENCVGILTATSINISTPSSELGCHYNTYRNLRANGILSGGTVLLLCDDFGDNEVTDVAVVAGPTPVNCTGVVWGSNGTLGCSRNHIGVLNFTNVIIGQALVPASVGNVVDLMIVNGVQVISNQLYSGSELTIHKVKGSITSNSGIQFAIVPGSKCTCNSLDVSITRTTGNTLGNIGGTLILKNAKVTHAGSGFEYGFIDTWATPGARIELESCDLGSWTTKFEAMLPGDTIRMRGRVDYTGSLQSAHLSRSIVTANGVTAVKTPFPGVSATSRITSARKTVGGTPSSLMAIATAGTVGTFDLAILTQTGLTGYPGSLPLLIEDNGFNPHSIVGVMPNWAAGVPVIVAAQMKTNGRNALIGDGATLYGSINLTTGAIPETLGPGVVAWSRNDGGGNWTLFVYSPSWAGSGAVYVYLEATNAAGLVYPGDGTSGIYVYSLTATILDHVACTALASDTSQYEISIE